MEDTTETKKEFATVMWGVAEEWGGKISKPGLVMRFRSLKKYSIDQISRAGSWLVENRKEKYPPVPTTKEFIEAINEVGGGLSVKARAGCEADKVLKKLKDWGREAQPFFYDETTKYLMTHRWSFAQLDTDHVKDPGYVWFRKAFVEAYEEMESSVTLHLAGGNAPQIPEGEKISSKRLGLLVSTKSMEE